MICLPKPLSLNMETLYLLIRKELAQICRELLLIVQGYVWKLNIH